MRLCRKSFFILTVVTNIAYLISRSLRSFTRLTFPELLVHFVIFLFELIRSLVTSLPHLFVVFADIGIILLCRRWWGVNSRLRSRRWTGTVAGASLGLRRGRRRCGALLRRCFWPRMFHICLGILLVALRMPGLIIAIRLMGIPSWSRRYARGHDTGPGCSR